MVKNRWVFPAASGGVLVAGGVVVYYSGAILVPPCIAFFLAFIFDPFVGYLERRGLNRTVSIFVVLVLITLLAVLGIGFFVSSISHEFQSVSLNLPEYASRLYAMIPEKVKAYYGVETPEKAYLQIQGVMEQLRGVSFEVVRETLAFLKQAVSSTLALVLSILGYVVIPLYLYYFLKDLPRIRSRFTDLVPERFRDSFAARIAEIHDILTGFVRGQLTVCAMLAVLYSIGLWVIGIDLAVVIGTLSGILFIIPYLGTVIGIVLSMLMAVLKFHDLLHPLLCLGWFIVVQALEGAVITPKIVGDKVGLHPLVIILALLIGGQLFGIAGMLIAVPVTAVLKVFLSMYFSCYRSSAFFTGK